MDHLAIAVKNISSFGDTDIFPFPMENALFHDMPEKVIKIVKDMEDNFEKWIAQYPVECIKTCVSVGYTGYRWATIIDPLWNCFLLYQTLKIFDKLEANRIPIDKESIFSYRMKIDESSGKLFDLNNNWRAFYQKAVNNAKLERFSHVIRFDISDFYNRIYHHRLDNALLKCNVPSEIKKRIMDVLQDISGNVSYGLPVGGNAARILAEILLNSLDQIMVGKRMTFCRFVDDYILFAESREDAFHKLNYCADFLLRNEGLGLQKSKTQILTTSEFISQATSIIEGEENEGTTTRAEFLKLHIHFDPYSATADQDYEDLKEKIDQFDILSLLRDEVRKSRIHQALGKQILNAIGYLAGEQLDIAFNLISTNLENLFPVFPSVMQIAHKKLVNASKSTQIQFIETLYNLVENDSYILQTDNNAAYVVRVFSLLNNEKCIQAIDLIHSRLSSPLVKVNCMYAMTNLDNSYWLSDMKSRFSTLSKWERRAFIPASYLLRDEGSHWREHTKGQFTEFEVIVRDWVASKNPSQSGWRIPL